MQDDAGAGSAVKFLVTGATGFIGQALCRKLLEQGAQLVALSRHGADLPGEVATLPCDLAREPVARELLDGVDVVVHLAGIAHQQAADDDYDRLNHRATVNLARASEQAGVGCFIFVSSVKAMGPSHADSPRNEQDVSCPQDGYGRSKWQAEQQLQQDFSAGEMAVVILRPALVYGDGARGNLAQLERAVARGLPRPPDVGRRSLIALPDLVEVIERLGHWREPGVAVFIACDRRSYSFQALYDLFCVAGGSRPGRVWLPLWVWRGLCTLRDGLRPAHGEGTYQKLFGTELYDGTALHRALQWQPRWCLSDVMERGGPGVGAARVTP